MRSALRRGLGLAILFGVGAISACTPAASTGPRPPKGPLPPPPPATADTPSLAGPGGLPARAIAVLPGDRVDLHVARHGSRGVLLASAAGSFWAGAFDASVPPSPSAPLSAELATDLLQLSPKSERVVALGRSSAEGGLGAIAAVGSGYIAAWLEPLEGEREIRAARLDEQAALVGPPVVVARSADTVRWVDVLAVGDRALVLYEMESGEGRELFVAPWMDSGTSRPPAKSISRGIQGWQVVAGPSNALVATVRGSRNDASANGGRLDLWRVTPDGKPSPLAEARRRADSAPRRAARGAARPLPRGID